MQRSPTSQFKMSSPLLRLLPYHKRFGPSFWAGASMLLAARVMEGAIPLLLRDSIEGTASDAESLGWKLAERLLNRGARALIEATEATR